ncbi:MAG: type II toxin-antitoxin system RelE/ParE family toxin [Erythrobacter sp.]|jgi:toxin ParE1/3/4
MRDLSVSWRAVADLAEIADFTIAEFGIAQARRYRDQFQACFDSLADNPLLGRSADDLAPGLRRVRQQAHVVFYRVTDRDLLIVRVLHQRMDFEQYL